MKRITGAQKGAKQQGHASEPLGSITAEKLRGQLKELLENSVQRSWFEVSQGILSSNTQASLVFSSRSA